MARKKLKTWPKWAWWGLWLLGVTGSLAIILFASFQIWMSTWKTYKNDEFGFSFKYPVGWSVSPTIPSKKNFDLGRFEHGDFTGFVFKINPENTTGVEVSFYKKMPPASQTKSRPVNCVAIAKENTSFSCFVRSGALKSLYVETDKYVFEATASPRNWLFLGLIDSKIIDNFVFAKK